MNRRRALWLLAPLVLLVLVLVLLPVFLDKDKLLALATATIQEQTGATLTVDGAVNLSLLPHAAISLEDVGLAMPEDGGTGLRLRSLQLGLRLLPLLSGQVEVGSLRVDGLRATLPPGEQKKDEDTSAVSDAELDAFYARRRAALAEKGGNADSGAALALPLALHVEQLTVTDSSVKFEARDGSPATEIVIQHLKAKALNLDGRPMALQAKLEVVAAKPVRLDIEGSVRLDQKRQVAVLDNLELDASGATAADLKVLLKGEVNIERRLAELQLELTLGDTRGEGSLRYTAFESPAIDATLHLNLFDPALLVLAGPEAASGAGNADAGGDSPLPLQALRSIDTRAGLTVDSAVFAAHTVDHMKLAVRADDGVVRIESLSGELYGGQLALTGTFNGRHNTATARTEGSLTGLDIASALAGAKVAPLASGRASLNWQLNSKGQTRNQLLADLNGPVRLSTEQVVLNDLNVEYLLCQAVALTNRESLKATFPPETRFQQLEADIRLADGSARLAPLRAQLPQVALTGTGSYQLLSKDFKANFDARLSPELETLDPACRVSKRLTAIDWPVKCAGNANGKPGSWCRVDTEEIITELGKNEAERKLKKEAGKLFDKLLNK